MPSVGVFELEASVFNSFIDLLIYWFIFVP